MSDVIVHRIQADGITLAVREHGGGELAVVALHGLASNARWWDLVARRLAPAHRVLALDLRGHGESDRPDAGYDFPTVAADVVAVIEKMHPSPVVVAGHSWGASVALGVAAERPDLVLAVICIDGGASDLQAYFGADWAVAEQAMRPPSMSGVTPAMLRGWVASSPLAEGGGVDAGAEILSGNFEPDPELPGALRPRLSLANHMAIAKELFHLDAYELMARTRCPVLFIPAGRPEPPDSPKVRAIARARDVLGDRCHVAWVDGVHDLPVQRPAEVAEAMVSFLAGL